MLRLTQMRLRGELANSQTLSALHCSPGSQSVLVSHIFPDAASGVSCFSFLLHPGKPGGQSALSLHFAGAGRPGRCGASPAISFWIGTRFGALRVPFVATT